jgi:hypothetical protein
LLARSFAQGNVGLLHSPTGGACQSPSNICVISQAQCYVQIYPLKLCDEEPESLIHTTHHQRLVMTASPLSGLTDTQRVYVKTEALPCFTCWILMDLLLATVQAAFLYAVGFVLPYQLRSCLIAHTRRVFNRFNLQFYVSSPDRI